ncbi:hypothetical protein DFJ58DRAFT_875409 [Suillus subalutaceus]|uniref:uncharacterized protein n=1 Tax=Suillus subalutaceus TaxID=48586 RepID=UPI001B86FB4B|nr:uncharacterized protein DFJ58DRAFT_875409 [Suillus subalutaceus]KAG1829547.1 hypothetical protein DFJ58DRAFT_875409 [Suillus subalutaceus]
MQIQDDGGFLSLMREYFASLGDSAHPESADPRTRAITRFQELLLISFQEFAVISNETILSKRRKHRNKIVNSIESFSKRSAIRNLKMLERFTKEQAGFIYDALYKAMCEVPPPPAVAPPPSLLATNDGHQERVETRIGIPDFWGKRSTIPQTRTRREETWTTVVGNGERTNPRRTCKTSRAASDCTGARAEKRGFDRVSAMNFDHRPSSVRPALMNLSVTLAGASAQRFL